MKIKLLLIIYTILTIYGCSKDSDKDGSSFSFQIKVQNITDRSASITWSEPDNKNIIYSIYLNNKLVEDDFRTRAYTFNKLNAETPYTGKIIATNGNETTTASFSFNTKVYKPIVLEGTASLNNQQDIDNFGSHHYNEIQYNLIISGTTIYDLSPLYDLKKVYGDLEIKYTLAEKSDGLENLELVGNSLYLYQNHKLKNLNSLENLTQIGGNIELFSNPELDNIDGLQNVSGFNGGLQIEGTKINNLNILQDATRLKNLYLVFNPRLENINSLGNINKIDEFIDIYDNPMLTNLNGLENLQSFGSLSIRENERLIDFCKITTAVINMNKEIDVQFNAFNPSLQDFINGDCSL